MAISDITPLVPRKPSQPLARSITGHATLVGFSALIKVHGLAIFFRVVGGAVETPCACEFEKVFREGGENFYLSH